MHLKAILLVRQDQSAFGVGAVVAHRGGAGQEVEEFLEEDHGVRGFGLQVADLRDVLQHEEEPVVLPACGLVLDRDDAEITRFAEEVASDGAFELVGIAVEECAAGGDVAGQIVLADPILGLDAFAVFERPDGVGGRGGLELVGVGRVVEIAEAGEGGRALERVRLAGELLAAFVFLSDVAEDDDGAAQVYTATGELIRSIFLAIAFT